MYARRSSSNQLGWIQAVPVVISTVSELSHLFSGGPSLADRIKTRIIWTVQQAQLGSTLAAALVYGGSRESSVNASERQAWTDVLSQVPQDTMTLALQRYPNGYWPNGQPDFYSDTTGTTHTTIVREVNAAAAQANSDTGGGYYTPPTSTYPQYPTTPPATSPPIYRPQGLPPVVTTAAFNYVPYLAVGGLLLYALTKPQRRS